jgi:putative DNA primase/helicase
MPVDPQSHAECLQFIRAAISENDPQTALDVASVVKEVCASGHANREAVWAELSESERATFSELTAKPIVLATKPTNFDCL